MNLRIVLRPGWPAVLVWCGAALLVSADATAVTVVAVQNQTLALMLTGITLIFAAFLAAAMALALGCSMAWHFGSAVFYRWRHRRRYTPAGRGLYSADVIAEQRQQAAEEERRLAGALARHAPDRLAPRGDR